MDFKEYKKAILEVVEVLDELILLEEKESAGEDVESATEAAMGKFVMKLLKLQSLSE
ncbi:MAG: hypothetical protein K0S61_4313 [Anaerocolumna sp.]|jgi:6-pyruvoyl-tetrahydropterin synthase|nr:hypothetical protein [Anaerocolumna sp.]